MNVLALLNLWRKLLKTSNDPAVPVQAASAPLPPCEHDAEAGAFAANTAQSPPSATTNAPCGDDWGSSPEVAALAQAGTQANANSAPIKHFSFLRRVGSEGLGVLHRVLPFLGTLGEAAEPAFDLIFPMCGPVYNSVVRAICLAEMAGKNSSPTYTSGEAKLASVLSLIGPQLKELADRHKLPQDMQNPAIGRYVHAIYSLLDGPSTHPASSGPTTTGQTAVSATNLQAGAAAGTYSEVAAARSMLAGTSTTAESIEPPCEKLQQAQAPAGSVTAESSHSGTGAPEAAPIGLIVSTQQANAASVNTEPEVSYMDRVIDLSERDAAAILEQALKLGDDSILGIMHQATRGVHLLDSEYTTRAQMVADTKLLWGAYHTGTGVDGAKQAEHFLNAVGWSVGSSLANTLLALNVSKNQDGPDMNLHEILQFVRAVQSQTQTWPGICGGYYLRTLLLENEAAGAGKTDVSVLANCWLWWTQFGGKPVLPDNLPWKAWKLWKHSDGHEGLPSKAGPACSRDSFDGTTEELRAWWAPAR